MEPQPIYENYGRKNCNKSSEREQSEEYIYANEETPAPQNLSCRQTEAKTQNYKGSRCFVLSAVCLGLICVLLVSGIIMMHIKNMAEREESNLRYRNVVIQSNQIQAKYNELTAEKENFMFLKRQDLETRVEQVQSNGWHWYFINSEEKSWSDSRQFCRDHGGDLVIINSEEEQRFISSFKQNVWIGLSDIKKKGKMKWVDNSPLKKGFWPKNPLRHEKVCVEVSPAKDVLNNWNVSPCSEKKKWICENWVSFPLAMI
ncbi:CD209 antigen-like protein C [Myxocyprinus asiaticus]|uniref:CD209 antigen-like protein C n=1 Tax=Myxocyprinus asiaticus TaxID=70543 RepID=UPI0022214AE3|nr:CD209 antigen-like protein C [Myxocyprinus asiaticus]